MQWVLVAYYIVTYEPPEWEPPVSAVLPVSKAIASSVQRLRAARGLTQEQLAEEMRRLGFDWKRITVAEVEGSRQRSASIEELLGLAKIFNVSALSIATASVLNAKRPEILTVMEHGRKIEITPVWQLSASGVAALGATGSADVDPNAVILHQQITQAKNVQTRLQYEKFRAERELTEHDRLLNSLERQWKRVLEGQEAAISARVEYSGASSEFELDWIRRKVTRDVTDAILGEPTTNPRYRFEMLLARDLDIPEDQIVVIAIRRWMDTISEIAEERTAEALIAKHGDPDDYSHSDIPWSAVVDQDEYNRDEELFRAQHSQDLLQELRDVSILGKKVAEAAGTSFVEAERTAFDLWGHIAAAEIERRKTQRQANALEEVAAEIGSALLERKKRRDLKSKKC